jgi:hypothetical protein
MTSARSRSFVVLFAVSAVLTIAVGPVLPQTTNRERMKAANEKKKADAERKKEGAGELGRGRPGRDADVTDGKQPADAPRDVEAPRRPPAFDVEHFKGVIRLDSVSKKNDFDLLMTQEREELLAVAANIAGLPGAPAIQNHARDTALSHLLDRQKSRQWLATLAEKDGALEFVALLGVPESEREGIKARFALLNLPSQIEARKLAQSIKEHGLSGLADHEKKRVRADKELFNVE